MRTVVLLHRLHFLTHNVTLDALLFALRYYNKQTRQRIGDGVFFSTHHVPSKAVEIGHCRVRPETGRAGRRRGRMWYQVSINKRMRFIFTERLHGDLR